MSIVKWNYWSNELICPTQRWASSWLTRMTRLKIWKSSWRSRMSNSKKNWPIWKKILGEMFKFQNLKSNWMVSIWWNLLLILNIYWIFFPCRNDSHCWHFHQWNFEKGAECREWANQKGVGRLEENCKRKHGRNKIQICRNGWTIIR